MQLRPIVSALGRHKVATVLIVLQVALTLAVASNALFFIATRMIHLSRPTGTDEAHIFVIHNGWKMGQNATQIDANTRADLDALRRVAGVRDAFSSEGYPLAGSDHDITARLKVAPDQTTRGEFAMMYAADDHAIHTLGISLIEGRNFRPDEIGAIGPNDKLSPPSVIITRSLAGKLFPGGPALGKTVYFPHGPAAIIGIVDSLQGPLFLSRASDGDSVLVPTRYLDPDGVMYLVRTDSATLQPVIDASLKALHVRDGLRVIDPKKVVVTLAQAREHAYSTDRSVALFMSIVCALLLLATACGIVGLSSFWVSQRRKQIGIRRSLGATRGDILRYFHAENFLIVSGGVVLGSVLSVLISLSLMTTFFPFRACRSTCLYWGRCCCGFLGNWPCGGQRETLLRCHLWSRFEPCDQEDESIGA